MESFHICLLWSSSTILSICKQVEKGLNAALATVGKGTLEIEITKEFIGVGGNVQVESSINKLLNCAAVDLVIGIAANRVSENVAIRSY